MEDIDQIKALTRRLGEKLPREVPSILKASDNETLLKVCSIRGALIHRVYELGVSATDHYGEIKFIPAVVMTRAVFETAALIFVLHKKINRALEDESTDDLSAFLKRVILGSRNSDTEVSAYNILNAIDDVTGEYENCREFYDQLSEFSHPNFAGVQASYSFMSEDKTVLMLGPDPKSDLALGYIPLKVALIVADHYYEKLLQLDSELFELCGLLNSSDIVTCVD